MCLRDRSFPEPKGWTEEVEEDVSVPKMLKNYVLWDKIRYQWCIFFINGLVCGLGHTQPLILFSCFFTLLVHVGPRCLGCRFYHPRNAPLCCAETDPCLAAVSLVCKQTHSPQQEKPEDCYQIRRPGCWLGQQRYRGKVKDSFQIHSCSEEAWSSFWSNSYFWDCSGSKQMLLDCQGLPLGLP